jgi:hypothetical protein
VNGYRKRGSDSRLSEPPNGCLRQRPISDVDRRTHESDCFSAARPERDVTAMSFVKLEVQQ